MSDGRNGKGLWRESWQTARAVVNAMGITFRNLWRKPVTVQYPDVTREYPDRYITLRHKDAVINRWNGPVH